MPLPQFNFAYSVYESDDGVSYALKSDAAWIADAASGGAAVTTEKAYGRATTRRHPRKVIFQDPTTFRTRTLPVFTADAYTALGSGDTLSVPVVGSATAVTYNYVSKSAEKIGRTVVGRTLPDHA